MPSLIFRVARNRLRVSAVQPSVVVVAHVAVCVLISCGLILVVPVFRDREIRAASVIHPDAIFVSSPAVSFGANGVAVLRNQAHSASYVHRAGVSSHIVGVAGNPGLAQ
jgi:hypothetical protein